MENLSVTIITKNEAANIGDCLRSVQQAAEIIVVDQFSTDETESIVRSFPRVKFYQESWKGYAAQKNSAIDKAAGPWILSLDADERATPLLWGEIEAVLNRADTLNGYYIARKNFFCGRWIRHSGWYPDYNLRLFRKSAARFEERDVHERVVMEGSAGYLKHPMEHHTYRSVAEYLERLERYSRLAARELSGRGRQPTWTALLLRPLFTFFKMYGLKRGFLDGKEGFFLAIAYAYYTFLKYYRLHDNDFDR
jgi:glycosyltransferase involved in cell wall biosynthesis